VRGVSKYNYVVAPIVLIAISLLIPLGVGLHVEAQQVPREDTVYVIGAQWGPPPSWNLYSPQTTWGAGLFLYVPMFIYSWFFDAWLPLVGQKFEFVDKVTLRVYIRPEARWSDGNPITAQDVEYTYYVTQQVKLGPGTGCWDYVEYIKAAGEKVYEVKAKSPVNYFSFIGCSLGFTPMPKHMIQPIFQERGDKIKEWKNDDPAKQVVSGPYKLLRYDDTVVIYQRIDDWWGKNVFGLPAPKYLAHVIYKDNPSANQAFERGDADWAGTFIPSVWQLFDKDIRTWYASKPYYVDEGVNLLYINYKRKELASPAVRKAIAYAIPYADMLEKAYFGYGVQASMSMVNDLVPAFKQFVNTDLCSRYWGSPDCRVKTNLDIANKILDDAGIKRGPDGIRVLPDGTRLDGFTISVPYGWTDWMVMCEMIAENLRRIGIGVKTEFPDFSVWWNRIIEGTYDMIIGWSAGPGYDHPWNVYRFVLDPRLQAPAGNWERYNNPDIPQILDEIASTVDPAKRMELYGRLQEIIYRDLPAILLFYGAHWYAYSTKYWVGWPNNENPWWFPTAPWAGGNLPILFGIAKKGQTPSPPSWAKTIDQGGIMIPSSKVFSMVAAASEPGATEPAPTTAVITITAPVTVTATAAQAQPTTLTIRVTQPVPTTITTTSVVSETNWPITIGIAIALLVVGVGIGYILRRR